MDKRIYLLGTTFVFHNPMKFNFLYIINYFNMRLLTPFTMAILFLALSLTSVAANNAPDNNVKFHTGSFESGLSKANSEGKLLFVEFYADWCTPCKWMDKTTFKNTDVVDLMNTNYVALKMDIENDEGSELKSQYSVRMLPTILIFNSAGKMVDRIEKTLSSDSMVSLLSFHLNSDGQELTVSYPYNSSPTEERSYDKSLDEMYNNYLSAEKNRTNYKVQVANFTDYSEAFKKVNELSEVFIEPIIVINEYVENMTHYKVMMGEFNTMAEAEGFRRILQRDFGISAIIH